MKQSRHHFPFTKAFRLFPVLLMGGAILSACSSSDLAETLDCPNITVLEETRSLTRMIPGTAKAALGVTITSAGGTCEYDIDDDTKTGEVEAELTVAFAIARAAGRADEIANFDYFAAVTDAEGNVLNKAVFGVRAPFPKGEGRFTMKDDPLTLTIPLKSSTKTLKADKNFFIVVGLQLSASELEYNRKIRTR